MRKQSKHGARFPKNERDAEEYSKLSPEERTRIYEEKKKRAGKKCIDCSILVSPTSKSRCRRCDNIKRKEERIHLNTLLL